MQYKTQKALKNVTIKNLPQWVQQEIEDLKALTNDFGETEPDDEIKELDAVVADDIEQNKPAQTKNKSTKTKNKSTSKTSKYNGGGKKQPAQNKSKDQTKSEKEKKSPKFKTGDLVKHVGGADYRPVHKVSGQPQWSGMGEDGWWEYDLIDHKRKLVERNAAEHSLMPANTEVDKKLFKERDPQERKKIIDLHNKQGSDKTQSSNSTKSSSNLPNQYEKRLTKAQADTIEHYVQMYKDRKTGQKILQAIRVGDEKCIHLKIYDIYALFPYKYFKVTANGQVEKSKPATGNRKVIIPARFFKDMYRTYQNQQKCGNAAEALRSEGSSEAGGYLGKYCGDLEGQKAKGKTTMQKAHERANQLKKQKGMKHSKALSQALREIHKKS